MTSLKVLKIIWRSLLTIPPHHAALWLSIKLVLHYDRNNSKYHHERTRRRSSLKSNFFAKYPDDALYDMASPLQVEVWHYFMSKKPQHFEHKSEKVSLYIMKFRLHYRRMNLAIHLISSGYWHKSNKCNGHEVDNNVKLLTISHKIMVFNLHARTDEFKWENKTGFKH